MIQSTYSQLTVNSQSTQSLQRATLISGTANWLLYKHASLVLSCDSNPNH